MRALFDKIKTQIHKTYKKCTFPFLYNINDKTQINKASHTNHAIASV